MTEQALSVIGVGTEHILGTDKGANRILLDWQSYKRGTTESECFLTAKPQPLHGKGLREGKGGWQQEVKFSL